MQWNDNMDEAPRDGTEIIVYHQKEGPLVGYYTAFWKTYGEYIRGQDEITHWMPMPEAPKGS